MRELLEKYAERCRTKALATKTLERYEELAKCHLLPVIGGLSLARLKPTHVANVYAKAAEKGLSPKSVRHVHSLIHAALEWAVEQNLCFRNVADVAKRDLPKAQRSPAKALTEEEARRLLDAALGTPGTPSLRSPSVPGRVEPSSRRFAGRTLTLSAAP